MNVTPAKNTTSDKNTWLSDRGDWGSPQKGHWGSGRGDWGSPQKGHWGSGRGVYPNNDCATSLHAFIDLGDTLFEKNDSGKLTSVRADVREMVEHLRAEQICVSVWSAKTRANVMRAIKLAGLDDLFTQSDIRAQGDCQHIVQQILMTKKFKKGDCAGHCLLVESKKYRALLNKPYTSLHPDLKSAGCYGELCEVLVRLARQMKHTPDVSKCLRDPDLRAEIGVPPNWLIRADSLASVIRECEEKKLMANPKGNKWLHASAQSYHEWALQMHDQVQERNAEKARQLAEEAEHERSMFLRAQREEKLAMQAQRQQEFVRMLSPIVAACSAESQKDMFRDWRSTANQLLRVTIVPRLETTSDVCGFKTTVLDRMGKGTVQRIPFWSGVSQRLETKTTSVQEATRGMFAAGGGVGEGDLHRYVVDSVCTGYREFGLPATNAIHEYKGLHESMWQLYPSIVGQAYAKYKLLSKVRTHFLQHPPPVRPPLVLACVGHPGHGKTEIARRLTSLVDRSKLITIDCTTQSTAHELAGAGGSYQGSELGSELGNFIREKAAADKSNQTPYFIVLDEFDSLNKEAKKTLFRFFDEGVWVDKKRSSFSSSTEVQTNNVVVLLTTNVIDAEVAALHETDEVRELLLHGEPDEGKMTDMHVQEMTEKRARQLDVLLQMPLKEKLVDRLVNGCPALAGLHRRIKCVLPFFPFDPTEQRMLAAEMIHDNVFDIAQRNQEDDTENLTQTVVADLNVVDWLVETYYRPQAGAPGVRTGMETDIQGPIVEAAWRKHNYQNVDSNNWHVSMNGDDPVVERIGVARVRAR